MKTKNILSTTILAVLINIGNIYSQNGIKYFGLKTPGATPEIFALKVVSSKTHFEFSNTFSIDGKEFYFSRRINGADIMLVLTLFLLAYLEIIAQSSRPSPTTVC